MKTGIKIIDRIGDDRQVILTLPLDLHQKQLSRIKYLKKEVERLTTRIYMNEHTLHPGKEKGIYPFTFYTSLNLGKFLKTNGLYWNGSIKSMFFRKKDVEIDLKLATIKLCPEHLDLGNVRILNFNRKMFKSKFLDNLESIQLRFIEDKVFLELKVPMKNLVWEEIQKYETVEFGY